MPSVRTPPPSPVVTDADVARAAKSQPKITDRDIEEAARRHQMPSDADLSKVPVPSTPRVDALPQPISPRKIDLGAIARGYEAMGEPKPSGSSLGPSSSLLVFVSFSMSDATLSRLLDQAERSGATLLLRGFAGDSLQQTVSRSQGLIGNRNVGFQIDPQAFDRFSVRAVPTFVLLKEGAVPAPCAAGTCYSTNTYVSVAGDVSIDYALEHIKRAAGGFGREADTFLAKLRRR
ncbi:type-F conjugative transfer system pilin assembly protein TrbC [Biomphalaria pfeifferi]|uniref:Type-F conjugative transfer system pilin assembly protein TrbC n=1 Tax=Biomphalaria pfeifferi TaxID=112525 RepID=A0AAD8ETL2_BIOPF|nr:type-F conjugative transfer system pilin assembly protein TrbC [Biomphalaria pfeifferi]